MDISKIKKDLDETLNNLFLDDTDLVNIKAIEKINSALFLIETQEGHIKYLKQYKSGFIILALLSFVMVPLLIFFFQHTNRLINRKIEYSIYNINEKRIVIKQREVKHPITSKQSQFLAFKIKSLNPRIDSHQIANLIVSTSNIHKVDPFLVGSLIYYESNFNTQAVSSAKAMGLMQLLHSTANYVSLDEKISKQDLHIPERNLKLGIAYLQYLSKLFNKDLDKMLMAYNWGPNHLNNALKNKKAVPIAIKNYARNITALKNKWTKEFNG